jgi:Transposase, Mutator family/Integrase core domain
LTRRPASASGLIEDPAGVCAALAEGHRGAADPVPARALDRRLWAGLRNLLGEDASGLSSSSIQRLTESWQAEHAAFRTRELRFHRYAYLFVDGVNVGVRLGEDPKLCLLVVIGVREDGEKELLAVEDGYRESEDSWAAVFRDLRDRGMNAPKLVTGDGALGAWAALRDVSPVPGSSAAGSTRPRTSSTRSPSGCSRARRSCCTRWPRRPHGLTLARRWRALPGRVRRQVPEGRLQLDNAVAETFFATLKKELVNRRAWPSRLELQTAVSEHIEAFHNRQRRHSTLNMLSPATYKQLQLSPLGG